MPPTEQVAFPLCTFVSFVLKPLTLKPQKDTKVHEGEPTDIEWWSLSLGRKLEHGLRMKCLARLKNRRRKIRMIGRVWKMLCL